jgi:hypothetical protein
MLICRHGKSNFCIGLRQINPTGKSLLIIRNDVKPLLQKYFSFPPTQISSLIRCLVPPEGRSRVVTSAGRDAVDVKASGAQRQSQGEMNLVSGQLACRMIGAFCVPEVVRSMAPVAGAKFAEARRPDRAG